ncbi:MAG: YitT family protein [Acetivibrio ethanolgignens]
MKSQKFKDFLIMTMSTLVMAVGVYFFKFPNNFTFGGVTGYAPLVAKTGLMSAGDFSFIANMVLLVIGLLFLGRGFATRTAYTSILLSVIISILERLVPMKGPLTNEPILELVFAIALPAFGSAILFNMDASSGGTDVIAMLFKKYTSIHIGNALLATDLLVVFLAFFMFDIKTGLFSLLGLTIKSFMVDGMIESINLCKYFNIVCDDPEPICNFIVNKLKRSATICEGTGAFSGNQKYVIFTVMGRYEAIRLRNYIRDLDQHAFILITNTSEIVGKGFHNV